MVDDAAAAGEPQQAPCVAIARTINYSISTDGTCALLVLECADERGAPNGEKLAIEMPITAIGGMRATLADMAGLAARRMLDPGMVRVARPTIANVGNSDHERGKVFVQLDPGLPGEYVFALPDELALRVSDMIRRDVTDRTPNGGGLNGLALPRRGRLILPQ